MYFGAKQIEIHIFWGVGFISLFERQNYTERELEIERRRNTEFEICYPLAHSPHGVCARPG